MTDEEAVTWCQWLIDTFPPAGRPPPEWQPDDPNLLGYAVGYQYIDLIVSPVIGVAIEDVCVARIPVELCVTSLRRAPCEASVADLNMCVLTIYEDEPGLPSDDAAAWVVGQGCTGMWQAPSCHHTVVQMPMQAGYCAVLLE